ncbi:hypothetical protein CAEBREN_04640 [Caenorhabditis brenneri]|uniref:Uncharacterized protein n=1 Tax=Caenorhabditis brenneri TaxID=135651 RepID=G0MXA6_CAEBE|nr:hypothetical protein CAEBREN_04640 [Caenorhabditis brenneri]
MTSRQQKILAEHVHTLFSCSIQEAAKKKPITDLFPKEEGETSGEENIGLSGAELSKMVWCQLSEMRLSQLICKYKPVGGRSAGNMEKIQVSMNKIYDNEPEPNKMFIQASDQKKFTATKAARDAGKRRVVRSYSPSYTVRPSVEDIERKLNQWFNMGFLRKMHAENEAKEKIAKDKKEGEMKNTGENKAEKMNM